MSIGKTQLRVEPVGKHEGVLVSASDVYPLKPADSPVKMGQLAICRIASDWIGCRMEVVEASEVQVRTLRGDVARLRRGDIVVASAATELNLRRAFGKLSSRAEFEKAASRAGRPVAPAGYRVAPRSRVVALRASGWYSGVVADVHDDGAHVLFAPDNVSEQIPLADVVPEPPASTTPSRGDFALIRPPSPAEAWIVMRVLAPEGHDFKVVGADSVPRVTLARDVLPLGPAASNDAR